MPPEPPKGSPEWQEWYEMNIAPTMYDPQPDNFVPMAGDSDDNENFATANQDRDYSSAVSGGDQLNYNRFAENPGTGEMDRYDFNSEGNKVWQSDGLITDDNNVQQVTVKHQNALDHKDAILDVDSKYIKFAKNNRTGKMDKYYENEEGRKIFKSDVDDGVEFQPATNEIDMKETKDIN